ncbi:MAG: phosphoribosylamine--glycine ligase [Dehalococcoidia bacterium]|nr:MAG: phosphoribosylamine--glycine ligase [Dehalococcoidia bacterium]
MKILVVGSGAREHTIVWKLSHSTKVKEIFAAPGNAGTTMLARNLDINPNDIRTLLKTAIEKKVDLTVVGPEVPLAEGIVDEFQAKELPIFGPTKAASQIETSKVFSKKLMQKYNIPCAPSNIFSSYQEAKQYLVRQPIPIVIKADGLAAGKGVIVAETLKQAQQALDNIMLERVFGAAGDRVVIEEKLNGREMSVFSFSDTATSIPSMPACDYKPVFDGNRGPNTGGMGSYSPPNFLTNGLYEKINNTIMQPAVKAMQNEGLPYQGVLYGGLMITDTGPKVMEFNARFGDPETQVVLPRLKTDLVDIMLAVVNKKLNQIKIEWNNKACVGVVIASGGYPSNYKRGFPINGLDNLDDDILTFHAGTKLDEAGKFITSGGRVLTIVATAQTLAQARERVYNNISRIKFEGCHFRKDIALFDP